MSELVIVVDTQADFMRPEGALPVTGAMDIVAPLRSWLGQRDAHDTAAVLFTFDTHHADTYPNSAEAKLFPIHCVHGTPGWDNLLGCDAIAPAIPCATLEKGVFDMWAEPDGMVRGPDGAVPRDAWFARWQAQGVRDAVVVGVAADYCVAQAIAGLVARRFRVRVPRDLTRGILRAIDRVVAEDFADAPVVIDGGGMRAASTTSAWS